MKICSILIALILLLSASPAKAANKPAAPHLLGTFGLWRAYLVTEHKQPVCYMSLAAHFPTNAKLHRGDGLLTITHRPFENSKDVISYSPGYNYKPMSDATMYVGKNSFILFTTQDTAWSRDAATDHKIAAAIRTSPNMSISGTPKSSSSTFTDKFNLTGAALAYQAIGKACKQ